MISKRYRPTPPDPKAPPFHLLNAFTLPSSPYSGNQAAVVVLSSASDTKAKDEKYMQLTARDFNLSETAFIYPLEGSTTPDLKYSLRWFTVETEVDLCGHATLAASKVLFSLYPSAGSITFQTRWAGDLEAANISEDVVEITLPISPIDPSAATPDKLALCKAIGVQESDVLGLEVVSPGTGSLVIELKDEIDLRSLQVDFKALITISRGMVIVTQMKPAESIEKLVIKTRMFAPGLGIDEDPVTGSAHSILVGYYLASIPAARLPPNLVKGKDPKSIVIDAEQQSTRGGALTCRYEDGKAKITGRVEEMGRGTLRA